MFGWIRRMFSAASGAIDNTVRAWTHDLINGLYGFLHLVFGDIGKAWDILERSVLNFWHGLTSFVGSTVALFIHILKIIVPAIIREYRTLFTQAEKFITSVYNFVVQRVAYLIHLIASSIDSLWQLVLRDVWRPLLKLVNGALAWITSRGETVWYYISHPDKLIDLIWLYLIAKLEREAWNVASLLGKFFLSLIIHNLKRVALLLEDILNAVL